MGIFRIFRTRRTEVGPDRMSTAEFVRLVQGGYRRASRLEFEASNTGSMRVWDEADRIQAQTRSMLRRIRTDPALVQRVADEYSAGWDRPILITDAPMPVLVGAQVSDQAQDATPTQVAVAADAGYRRALPHLGRAAKWGGLALLVAPVASTAATISPQATDALSAGAPLATIGCIGVAQLYALRGAFALVR